MPQGSLGRSDDRAVADFRRARLGRFPSGESARIGAAWSCREEPRSAEIPDGYPLCCSLGCARRGVQQGDADGSWGAATWFWSSVGLDPIKIGHTDNNVNSDLEASQTAAPHAGRGPP